MLRKILIIAVLFSLILTITACASPTLSPLPTPTPKPTPSPTSTSEPTPIPSPKLKPPGPVKASWIESLVDGNTVSISLSEVEENWNTQFKLETQGGNLSFMSYTLGGEIYVRANVCPPCHSIGYTLDGDVLVCDRCATTFKAKTGDGIRGACVDYPKASVPYEIINGNIVMSESDLTSAYQDTVKPGRP